MKLTPLDIHHKEFRHSIRGYSEDEVDQFLDEVADDLAAREAEVGPLGRHLLLDLTAVEEADGPRAVGHPLGPDLHVLAPTLACEVRNTVVPEDPADNNRRKLETDGPPDGRADHIVFAPLRRKQVTPQHEDPNRLPGIIG